jgi:hypothetical protein
MAWVRGDSAAVCFASCRALCAFTKLAMDTAIAMIDSVSAKVMAALPRRPHPAPGIARVGCSSLRRDVHRSEHEVERHDQPNVP